MPVIRLNANNKTLTLRKSTNAITLKQVGRRGLTGEIGPMGPQGPKGEKGDPGTTDYNELQNKPTLGTAAATDVTDYATAEQGDKADTAVQPAEIADFETTTQLNTRDTANRSRTNHTGTQAISTVSGLQTALDSKQPTGDYATNTALNAHTSNTSNPHSVTKTQVGLANVPNLDTTAAVTNEHTHANKATLDATTASFTTADETKLDNIATGATANSTDATLLNRANHTGTQSLSTISDAGTAAALNLAVGTTAPSSPTTNDLWVDIS